MCPRQESNLQAPAPHAGGFANLPTWAVTGFSSPSPLNPYQDLGPSSQQLHPSLGLALCWRLCQFAYTGLVAFFADPQFACLWVGADGLADLFPEGPEALG